MADEPTPWWKDAKGIVLVITAIFTGITTVQTQCNAKRQVEGIDKIDHVASQQSVQLQKTQDIAIELENVQQKAAVIEHKAAVIDSKLPKKN